MLCLIQSIHAVGNEIKQHLLKLDSIAPNGRQIVCHDNLKSNLPCRSRKLHEGHGVVDKLAHIKRSLGEILPFEKSAHPVDDVTCPLVVLADVGKNCANFIEIRRGIPQKKLCSLSVA